MNKIYNVILMIMILSIVLVGIVNAQENNGLWTGCIAKNTGSFYNIVQGTVPLDICRSGDYTISFYDQTYVYNLTIRIDNLSNRVDNLSNQVNSLLTNVNNISSNIDNLSNRVGGFESLFANVTRQEDDIYFDSTNVHIRSGTGSTGGNINGLGNLIIGYNELRYDGTDNRTGSNNLILGLNNNYKSYGGIIGGVWNEISGQTSSVTGGTLNTASLYRSVVTGGYNNSASGGFSVVSGGASNMASASASSVSGGSNNIASGDQSSVSGGQNRLAPGYMNWAGGGLFQNS